MTVARIQLTSLDRYKLKDGIQDPPHFPKVSRSTVYKRLKYDLCVHPLSVHFASFFVSLRAQRSFNASQPNFARY